MQNLKTSQLNLFRKLKNLNHGIICSYEIISAGGREVTHPHDLTPPQQ